MIHFDSHRLFDEATVEMFEHEHLWLHLVAHVVMVVMPVILLVIFTRWLYHILAGLSSRVSVKAPFTRGNNAYSLPSGLFGFIFRYSGNAQLVLACIALTTLPVTYLLLELPKRIVNGAISAETADISNWVVTTQLGKVDYLLILCGFFLVALMTSSLLKYVLNIKMGVTAERLLRRIRLVVIRKQDIFSKQDLSRIPIITQEVEPVCSFSGDAIIVPMLHGGTLATIIIFMMMQNVVLGAAAISLLPVQLIVIPRLQRKVNRFIRKRVSVIREISNRLQEIDNLQQRAGIRDHIRELHSIRVRMFRIKFLMKALNNFIMNLTPFFFYTIGGYLVMESHLSLGALVASLASYKDLAPAIRELFKYYQRNQDAKLRYAEIRTFLLKTNSGNLIASDKIKSVSNQQEQAA
jgi:ABC-type multidrug transport system fused ATPase/permease subunit